MGIVVGIVDRQNWAWQTGSMMNEAGLPHPPTLAEAQDIIVALWTENAQLRPRLAHLEPHVPVGAAQAGQTSANASRPPSTAPPQALPRPPRRPTGRRRGAQSGHAAQQRSPRPLEQIDSTAGRWSATGQHGQAPLAATPDGAVGDPVRQQVVEVPPGAFGPRLQAIVAVLSSRYRLSRREVAARCADLLGADLCVSSVDDLCQAASQAVATPVAALQTAIQQAPVVNTDETEWRQAGQHRWRWVAVSAMATGFTGARSRDTAVYTAAQRGHPSPSFLPKLASAQAA
jgi:transposase